MRNDLLIAAKAVDKPTWGDLRITVPVLLLGGYMIAATFTGGF